MSRILPERANLEFLSKQSMAQVILGFDPPLEARERDFGQTPLDWTIYGSINGWYAERGDYAGVAELLLAAGAKAPLTPKVKGSEAVLTVLRRHTSLAPGKSDGADE